MFTDVFKAKINGSLLEKPAAASGKAKAKSRSCCAGGIKCQAQNLGNYHRSFQWL